MAIEKTLTEMIRAVGYTGGIKTGAGATFRHTTDDIVAEINSAFVMQQELSVILRHSFYAVEGALTTLPTSRASTSENFSLVDWPLTAHDIVRVDILVNSEWDKLEHIDWENLRDVCPRRSSSQSQRPTHFSAQRFASVATDTAVVGKIAIAPFCSSGQYKLHTLPVWAPITNVSHKFIFASEHAFRWTVATVITRTTTRDRKPGGRYQTAMEEKAECRKAMGGTRTVPEGGTIRRARRRWG